MKLYTKRLTPKRFSAPLPQTGIVLMTTLVFLVVFTLLGLSSMGASRLELRMSANAQNTNQAFQAAESGIEATLADRGIYNTGVFNPAPYYFNPSQSGAGFADGSGNSFNETVTTQSVYQGVNVLPNGGCIGIGDSCVTAKHLSNITSVGLSQSGGRSVHQQGFSLDGAPL